MALGALVSSPSSPGGGGEDASGPAIARPGAKSDTPEARALGKQAISLVGSAVECSALSQKRQAEVPTLAPRKALKVSTSSTAQWVVEVQATIQCGAASARADPKEPVAQGEATEVATKQAEEEEPTPSEAEAHELDGAEAPSLADATKGEAEAPRTSKAKGTEAGVPRTTEAEVAEAGAPGTTEAGVAVAGVSAAKPAAQEVEIEAGKLQYCPRFKARHRCRRALRKWRSIRSPPMILPRGRRWRMPRWPAPWSSRL
ncbi:uncharacterized protein [Miscanthus floridulus]|uniref:uncharacterized protein n=1 Tax=Miscanthus floridulus TaxID=154761 RepID=UPI003459978C